MKQSAIPYHARENSLPFSYGQIGNTSTPLKSSMNSKINGNGTIGNGRIGGYGSSAYNDDSYKFANYNNNAFKNSNSTVDSSVNNGMLKAQPRLTSPILVRKTLNRSPTRTTTQPSMANTNTISNTYHYKYNDNSFDSFGNNSIYSSLNNTTASGKSSYNSTNGVNNGSTSNHFGYNNIGNSNNNISGSSSTLRSRTPTRNDFEDLLRERREKVFNEYRTTTHELQPTATTPTLRGRLPPIPPQRQWHLTSSLPAGRIANGNLVNSGRNAPSTQKYNYDFEFNLNLIDEVDAAPQIPKRTHTIDRSSIQQYHTRNIPLPEDIITNTNNNINIKNNNYYNNHNNSANSSYVERIYHTIGSSNTVKEQQQRPLYATLSSTEKNAQQPQRRDFTAYGNENVSSYGYNNNNNTNNGNTSFSRSISTNEKYEFERDPLNGGVRNNMNSNGDLSPIYATTTKQAARFASNNNINNKSMTTQSIQTHSQLQTATDYPSPTRFGTMSRPETPAFPVTPRTPYGTNNGIRTPTFYPGRNEYGANGHTEIQNYSTENIYQTTNRPRLNSSLSIGTTETQEVAAHLVKFAKDSSKFWYKPNISREDAISLLLNAAPGTFLVRDSTTYKNAFGLVLRVSQAPPGSSLGKRDELVRHFLIEPTTRGVRLKGCANEPVFTSLSALIYEHSINQLALPCLLRIPEQDIVPVVEPTPGQRQLITQGAACNVLWLFSCETESLTGAEAIRKAIRQLYAQKPLPMSLVVHFKVTKQGITLTDNTRKKFFRKHYSADIISFCAIDPDNRMWTIQEENKDEVNSSQKPVTVIGGERKTIFAFVARRSPSSKDNQCHVFCDLAINQPASAIVAYINNVLPTEKQKNHAL